MLRSLQRRVKLIHFEQVLRLFYLILQVFILEAQIRVRFVEEQLVLLARRQIIHVLRLSIATLAVLQRLPQLLQLLPQPRFLLV